MHNQLKEFLQNRKEVKFAINVDDASKKTATINETQSENSENEKGEITLRIKTNSISPIQNSAFGKWTEEIAAGAFDESISKNNIFSFLDHEMKTENTIGSTREGNMQISKVADGYEAKIKLDLNDSKSAMLYNKIKKGVIVENSFIFIPEEVEYIEKEKDSTQNRKLDNDVAMHVIHKKGNLISVDPVVLAFYPQNNITFKSKGGEMKDPELKTENVETQHEATTLELTPNDYSDEIAKKDAEILELLNLIERMKAETQADKDKKDDEEKVNVDAPDHQENADGEKIDGEKESKKDTESKEATPSNDDESDDDDDNDDEKDDEEEVVRQIQISRQQPNELKQKLMEKKQMETVKQLSFKDISKAIIARKNLTPSLTNVEFKNGELEILRNKINEYKNENRDFVNEINLLSPTALATIESRALDASTLTNGLAYISYINDPEVKTELELVFPEIKGAEYISLETLDIVKKDLLIPNANPVSAELAEGAEAQEDQGTTVSVEFKAQRYAKRFDTNPALANQVQLQEKQTLNHKNDIIANIRAKFYQNLFQYKTENFANVQATYSGGFTKEAIVQTQKADTLQLSDIDTIINNLTAEYGDSVVDKYQILMHPNTLTFIVQEVRKLYNAEWLMNETQRSYRGIKIITSTAFPNFVDPVTGSKTNTVAMVFYRKDMITVRGLNFVIEDTPYVNFTKGTITRMQTTRGEVKLIDPYINTIALATSTITRSVKADDKKEAKEKYEIAKANFIKEFKLKNNGLEPHRDQLKEFSKNFTEQLKNNK